MLTKFGLLLIFKDALEPMMDASHFSGRTLLGSPKKDILISGARKNERLYGGKRDDILISYGRSNHLHGGSGADTFAFMANPKRHARLLTDGKISNQHVIHDFDASEGDKIDLSHILKNSKKEILKIRKNDIKGKGVEIQFSPGAKVIVQKSKKGFANIEDGIKDSLGEIPGVTHRKHKSKGSKLKIYVDGHLHSEVILKHKPGKEYISRTDKPQFIDRKSMRSFDHKNGQQPALNFTLPGRNPHPLPEVWDAMTQEIDDNLKKFYEENSAISITPQGIPFYGNGAKVDIKPPVDVFGGVEHWSSPRVKVDIWKAKIDIDFYLDVYLGVNLGPKFTLFTGSIPGQGTLPAATWGVSESLDFDPPFDVRAGGGTSFTATVDVTEDGLNKAIWSEALYKAELDFSLSQDGPYIETFTERKIEPLNVAGGNNYKSFDSLTGVEAKLTISPELQLDVGVGVSSDGWHADLIDTGPKISAPIDIIVSGSGQSGIQFNAARLDWVTRLIDVGYGPLSISGKTWTHNIASMGEFGFIDFPKVCKLEVTGSSEC